MKRVKIIEWNDNVSLVVARILVFIKARSLTSKFSGNIPQNFAVEVP